MNLELEVEEEGWWNEDHTVYTWPITVNGWGGRIECHGSSPEKAKSLATVIKISVSAIANAVYKME